MGSILWDTMKDRLKKNLWSILSVCLLADSCCGAFMVKRSPQYREEYVGYEFDPLQQQNDYFHFEPEQTLQGNQYIGHGLDSSPQEEEFLKYGLDVLKQGLQNSLSQESAQDRIFFDGVQTLLTNLQEIINDPTNAQNILSGLSSSSSVVAAFLTVVIVTAFVAQISVFTLFGDPSNSDSSGIVGAIGNALSQVIAGVMEETENEEENDLMESEEDMAEEDGEEEITEEESMSEMESSGEEEEMEGSGEEEEQQPGIIESIITLITNIIGGNTEDNDEEEEGSGNMDEEDEMEESMEEMEEDMSDGGSSFGGVSVSLHPIDIAGLFMQLQEIIGLNCTCPEEPMSEEMITKATLRLMKEEQKKKKRKRKDSTKKTNLKNKQEKVKKKNKKDTRQRVPKTI